MGKVSGNGSVLILERPLPSLGRELAKFAGPWIFEPYSRVLDAIMTHCACA